MIDFNKPFRGIISNWCIVPLHTDGRDHLFGIDENLAPIRTSFIVSREGDWVETNDSRYMLGIQSGTSAAHAAPALVKELPQSRDTILSELSQKDLVFVMSRVPKDVRRLMKEEKLWLGGGFIREVIAGGEPKDIDLFGQSQEQMKTALGKLKASRENEYGSKCRIHSSDNADTLLTEGKYPVQVIHRWIYEKPYQVVDSFDFSVCAAVIYYDENGFIRSAIHNGFYMDLAARRLVYTSPQRNEDAGGSLLRVLKFIKRGYNIQTFSLGAVIARLNAGVRASGVATTEEGMARIYTSLLKEVDPQLVVDGIDVIDEMGLPS